MNRNWLAVGISIIAAILLTLTSLSNVVGYQSVRTSQQNILNERIDQRELLFQTICNIANNKEIQRIIFKSQMSRGIFPISYIPVVTKQHLRQMYLIGLILSKIINTSELHSMVQKLQLVNPEIRKKITAIIEKDAMLNAEITQLRNSDCDCQNENTTGLWPFPVICLIALSIFCIGLIFGIFLFNPYLWFLCDIGNTLGAIFDCFWMYY